MRKNNDKKEVGFRVNQTTHITTNDLDKDKHKLNNTFKFKRHNGSYSDHDPLKKFLMH